MMSPVKSTSVKMLIPTGVNDTHGGNIPGVRHTNADGTPYRVCT